MSKDWEKHVNEWQNQGFLSEEAATKIRQFEQNRGGSGSRLMLALTILAVLSIGLGLISVIAANWQEIPAWFKLLAYFLLMGGQVFALLRWDEKDGIVREGLHGLYILSILAGIGLIAQVFHVPSDGWRGQALWSALSLGIMLRARSWYPVVLWQCSFAAAWFGFVMQRNFHERLDWALLSVALLCIISSWRGRWALPEPQRRLTLLMGSFFLLIWVPWLMSDYRSGARLLETPILPALGLAVLWLLVLSRQLRRVAMLAAGFVALTFFARWIVCFEYALEFKKNWANLAETILFIGQLTALGILALQFQAGRIFDVLTLGMAIRLLILFFTLFGSLLTTGVGLILFGLVVLGLLHVWYRYRQKLQQRLKDILA